MNAFALRAGGLAAALWLAAALAGPAAEARNDGKDMRRSLAPLGNGGGAVAAAPALRRADRDETRLRLRRPGRDDRALRLRLRDGRGFDRAPFGGLPPGLAKRGGLPPGLAKRGRLPPGLRN